MAANTRSPAYCSTVHVDVMTVPQPLDKVGDLLQEATGGKFRLGLGTQVRTHVVRRYGMAFERPGPRLRDYVLAVKACFVAFRTGTLDHHGKFYDWTSSRRSGARGRSMRQIRKSMWRR
jgi:alkanesulfonate monooxygenase SsuD/methylene tetrahydromethanopterin reductase-like flavin-dependent oxidoreductase (luciferase family)